MSQPSLLSFEFFPPRSEAQSRRFWRTLGALEPLAPDYISLTWGALGSDSRASLETLALLARDTTLDVAAHLSCIGQTRTDLRTTLDTLESFGIRRIVALRGDVAAGNTLVPATCRHASDLVELIAAERPHLDVSVAAYPEVHPEARDEGTDLQWLERKLEAGAARAITQFFFEPGTYLRWRDRAVRTGIEKPLVPGILPIHDIDKVCSFATKCGAAVPDTLRERFDRRHDEASRRAMAIEHAVELCRALECEGVEAFHLYTLNQSTLAHPIACELMGIDGVRAAA